MFKKSNNVIFTSLYLLLIWFWICTNHLHSEIQYLLGKLAYHSVSKRSTSICPWGCHVLPSSSSLWPIKLEVYQGMSRVVELWLYSGWDSTTSLAWCPNRHQIRAIDLSWAFKWVSQTKGLDWAGSDGNILKSYQNKNESLYYCYIFLFKTYN